MCIRVQSVSSADAAMSWRYNMLPRPEALANTGTGTIEQRQT